MRTKAEDEAFKRGFDLAMASPLHPANERIKRLEDALRGMVRAVEGKGSVNLDPWDLGPSAVLVAARAALEGK